MFCIAFQIKSCKVSLKKGADFFLTGFFRILFIIVIVYDVTKPSGKRVNEYLHVQYNLDLVTTL